MDEGIETFLLFHALPHDYEGFTLLFRVRYRQTVIFIAVGMHKSGYTTSPAT